MNPLLQELKDLKPEKDFLIGFDSDGCIFDSMDVKHKECFCPAFIDNFDLQGASNLSREVWEFVNLRSKFRGLNRFLAVIEAINLISARDELTLRSIEVPSIAGLINWSRSGTKLGQAALENTVAVNPDPDLVRALNWSRDVSAAVAKIIRNLPPFPQVRGVLESISEKADLMVVSQTPTVDLEREWNEYSIADFVRVIAGQEWGTKSEHLKYAAVGKYDADKILLVGDAPGDLLAAEKNGVLFYPIVPGNEDASWNRFRDEAVDRFFAGEYAGAYQEGLLADFDAALPEKAPWQV